MTDADELASRYLALWTQYLTAFLTDPRALETLKRWIAFTGQFGYPPSDRSAAAGAAGNLPLPAWPPIFGPFGPLPMGGPVAAAPGEPTAAVDDLARRMDVLEQRVAALERRSKPRPARRRTRTAAK